MGSKTPEIKKVSIIIPYFGKWPNWINYYLISCKYNPTIDWYFFTDCGQTKVEADNLIFHEMNLGEFNLLASKKLQIPVSVKHPYKLCDFKPAYGKIFEDYIEGYDFWGYGDIDLIYGNIRKYYTNQILQNFDVLSNHMNFVTGHFCLLRNSNKMKHLFMQGSYYKRAFSDRRYIGFDEQILQLSVSTNPYLFKLSKKINLSYHLLLNYLKRSFLKKAITFIWRTIGQKKDNHNQFDFTTIINLASKAGELKAHFKNTFQSDLFFLKRNIKGWEIRWNRGTLINALTKEELLYFHFIKYKSSGKFILDDFNSSVDSFTIQQTGIKMLK